jgi:hypothetical protein
MVIADESVPADVVDGLLWQDAQHMLERHAEPGADGTCVWCGWRWPCTARRLAERAAIASRRPWREAWTLRHDLNSIRAIPGLRAGAEENSNVGRRAEPPSGRPRSARNRGYFD